MSLPIAQRPTSSSTEELPMAVAGQLQWVRRPRSSLSVLATEIGDSGEDPPCLWWPSVLFNDYNEFQEFFQDEFQPSPNDDETNKLIYSRMLQNMRRQRSIMVARLLGRPLREYVEIVEFSGEGSDDDDATVLSYQATEFVSFTRMPQEVHLPQMKPDAFTFEIRSENSSEVSVVIDDDLYMSYMHALDLAATKRMSGPIAPNDTLRSDFRDIGRSELEKLSSSVKRLSGHPTIVGNATKCKGPPKEQERSEGEKKEDSGKSDSEEETVSGDELKNAAKLSETQVEESTDTANLTTEDMDKIELSLSESESLACENALEASGLPKAEAESTSPVDSSPVDAVSGGQPESKKPDDTNDSDDNADTNGGIHSSSATVVSHSSDGPEATEIGTASLGTSPATASINSPTPAEKQNDGSDEKIESPEETIKDVETEAPKKSKRGRPRKSVMDLEENAKSKETPSPTKRSKRGRKPKEIVDLPESTKPSSPAPLSPTKKSKRGRKPKEIVDLPESAKPSSPAPLSPTKKSKRGRKPKATVPEPTGEKTITPAKTPRKQVRRGRPKKKKVDTPETPNKDDKSDAATPNDLLFTPPPQIERRLRDASKAVDSPGKTKGQDTPACTIVASPGCEEPDIRPDDSFEDVCFKLEEAGWNIDGHDNYLSPGIGFDDVKSKLEWKNKKFFLGKESFVAFLRQTYGWVGKKTPKSRGRKRSNTVTPTYSSRPKRSRRSPPLHSPIEKESPSKFKFKSTEEEEFYFFGNLMKGLRRKQGWQYLKSKFHDWVYVLPHGRKDSKGGKHLEDYFITEEEVVLYCMNNNYYERRHELGLVGDKNNA